jgi:hypothetical protein
MQYYNFEKKNTSSNIKKLVLLTNNWDFFQIFFLL